MANEIIQKHNFELAKDRILSASKKIPSEVGLNSFETEGSFFFWNDHNITGEEANEKLVKPVQEILMAQNIGIKDLFKISEDVYKALDALDKEYIAGIIGAVEAAKIASGQAKTASFQAKQASDRALDASSEALEASKKANMAQADIKRTIEALQKTVGILKDFKTDVTIKLNTLRTICNDVEGHKNDIAKIEEKLDSFISEVRITTNEIKESIKKQDEINSEAHLKFEKRIKIAYYIGGCAVGISLLNYLLQLIGVL